MYKLEDKHLNFGVPHQARRGASGSRGFRHRTNNIRKPFGKAKPFDPKRSFKKDYIDHNLFINKATVKEVESYTPTHKWEDFDLSKDLLANIAFMKLDKPSPIQDQSISHIIEGKDVIGIASTGTGKTAAFLIPLIKKLEANYNEKVLILCPTRELAEQVETQFRKLAHGLKLYSFPIVGGSSSYKQIMELKKGLDLIVGTPGRVRDLIEKGKIKTDEIKYVVLDEADRMLDMGFIDDMRYILGLVREDKQALFYSATFSPEIKNLCSQFLRDPITISIKSRDTSTSVDQDVIRFTDTKDKLEKLKQLLSQEDLERVLIFRETKKDTDTLKDQLTEAGFNVRAIHGDLDNRERKNALSDLRYGRAKIVIATDVAARGIDIFNITHVINYDIPNNFETYIHRIGRTGRGNRTGIAYTFVRG